MHTRTRINPAAPYNGFAMAAMLRSLCSCACRCAGKQRLAQAGNVLLCVHAVHDRCCLPLCTMQGPWDRQVDALGWVAVAAGQFCSQSLLKVFTACWGAWPVWWRPPAASVLFRAPLVTTSKQAVACDVEKECCRWTVVEGGYGPCRGCCRLQRVPMVGTVQLYV